MRRWIKVALFVAIAIAVVHDAGVYLMAVYRIDDTTRSIAFEASRTAKANPASQSAWPAAATAAKAAGLEVLDYQQSADGATLRTRISVPSTWVLGPAIALIERRPMATPLTLERTVTSTG